MKTIKNVCSTIAFFLFMFIAACADGMMDAYGFGKTCVIFLVAGVLGLALVVIPDIVEAY